MLLMAKTQFCTFAFRVTRALKWKLIEWYCKRPDLCKRGYLLFVSNENLEHFKLFKRKGTLFYFNFINEPIFSSFPVASFFSYEIEITFFGWEVSKTFLLQKQHWYQAPEPRQLSNNVRRISQQFLPNPNRKTQVYNIFSYNKFLAFLGSFLQLCHKT